MIATLAAGAVGTALGLVVAEFRRRAAPPTVPLSLFAAVTTNAAAAEAEANRRVDEAHRAMGVLAQELSDERREHVATKLRADTAEGHLRDLREAAAHEEEADQVTFAPPVATHLWLEVPNHVVAVLGPRVPQ